MTEQRLKTREETDSRYKWAIEDLYSDDEHWTEDYERLKKRIPELSAYQGRLGESAGTLLAMQRTYDELNELAEKVYVYANQRLHENTDNGIYQNLSSRARGLMIQLEEAGSYIQPELLKLPEGTVEKFLEENKELQVYRQYFENMIRQKEHVLGRELEEVLALVGELAEGPKDIFSMFNNADIRFPEITGEDKKPVEVTHGRFGLLLQSRDRNVRRDAFKALYSVYGKYRNTLAAVYRANVKQEAFYARVRKYGSDLEAALDVSHIPVSVYDNLIAAVHEFLPSMHRYVELRKKLLGVDELHMYDLYVSMVADAECRISFEQAKKMVLEGLSPMGEEYRRLLSEGFSNGWIDVYENQGKRSGAYSWGAYGTHPYVLLNYQENLNNVFTLAHEMGHALHSWYSDKNQPYVYAGYKIFVAEVASTCNEALLMDYLLKRTADKKKRAYLINHFLHQFRSTLYRQTMFAEFELLTHEMVERGETLTAESLKQLYYELNVQYHGKDVIVDKEIAIEWARIPHFYYNFYVYQYATSFAASMALSKKILEEGQPAVERYLNFLKGGCSKSPIDLLKDAGVDMTTKEPISEALKTFGALIQEMEELSGQI